MKRTDSLGYYLAGSVSLITFAVYLVSLRNGFVGWWDDIAYVIENPFIRSFNAFFFRSAFLDFYAANWHPLTWVSLALDYAVFGLNPLGYHLTNIVLHAADTFLVTILVVNLAGNKEEGAAGSGLPFSFGNRGALIAGGLAGMFFGLHPAHVESVAWISERKDLLCAFFFLLGIIIYTRHATAPGNMTGSGHGARFFSRNYLYALGCFVLALLSKPMAVTLPLVLIILDWYPFGRIRSLKTLREAAVEKLPFIFLGIVSSLVTVLAQKSTAAILPLKMIPMSTRLLVAVRSLGAYLWKMTVPLNLVPFYPYPQKVSLVSPEYLGAFVFLITVTAACVLAARRQKIWLAAWGYYVITLMPVLGIVQVGNQSMADRYTYLPSLGPFIVISIGAAWALKNPLKRQQPAALVALAAMIALVFVAMGYLTVKQIGVWKDSVTLWDYVIEKEPGKVALAYNNRGLAFMEMGLSDRAIEDFKMAITLDPSRVEPYNNVGMLYGRAGLYAKSIEYFNRSLGIDPANADAYCNRGLSYLNLGQYGRALEDLNRAVELKKNFAGAHLNRGYLYLTTGDREKAFPDFQKACLLGNGRACEALRTFPASYPDRNREKSE